MTGNWRIVRAPSPVQSCVAPHRRNGRSASARIPRLLVLRGYGATYGSSFFPTLHHSCWNSIVALTSLALTMAQLLGLFGLVWWS